MSVRSAQAITIEFITSNPSTQAALNADSTPAGTLVVNGTDNGATVTVTNVDTGRYKAAVTLPTLAVGDIVELSIAATVSAIAGKAVVWRDTKDILLDASGDVTFNNTSIATVTTVTTATNLTNAPTAGDFTATMKASITTAATAATPTVTAGTVSDKTGYSLAASQHVIVDSGTVTTLTNLPPITLNWLTAAGLATDAAVEIAGKVCDEINTANSHNIVNSLGRQIRALAGNTAVIYTATCPSQAGMSSTQIKLDSGASALDNVYQWNAISIISGTDAGDSAIITGYVGATKVATVNFAWAVQPDATSVFEITPTPVAQVAGNVTVGANLDKTGYSLAVAPPTANAIADACLIRDWTAVVGTVATRSTLNALRFLRNKWTLSGSTLTVFDEVGGTAWTSTVTATAGADPVTATNPS